jgi:capsular polysaccharide transport system permease protein
LKATPILNVIPRPALLRRMARRLDRVFIATVALPTLLAAVYFGLIASDAYISESRFVVRSPQRMTQTGLGALLSSTGFARAQDDTYSVHDYVLSRDALHVLDQALKVREAYSSAEIDFVNRFPGLDRDDSFEALFEHHLGHVQVDYDTASSITTLRVRAFTSEAARNINDKLLQMSEVLLASLNDRSRRDLVEVAEGEVRLAEARAKEATVALAAFRAKGAVYDPAAQSALQLQSVSHLQAELVAAQAQLAQVRRLAPSNPQVSVLAARVETLRKAVASETAKVTGRESSLNAKAPNYDMLVMEKGFADRQLGTALASLESARSEAARKHLYLERVVQPNLPDEAVEPRRLRAVVTVFVVGLLLWGVVALVMASVREHVD